LPEVSYREKEGAEKKKSSSEGKPFICSCPPSLQGKKKKDYLTGDPNEGDRAGPRYLPEEREKEKT